MRKPPTKTLKNLTQRSVLQAIAIGILMSFLLTFVYSLVHHYQQKRLHTQKLAELLASSASTAEGAELVANQVSMLLADDPTIKNIIFYSLELPINSLDQAGNEQNSNDWYNACFADTVSFNRPVTSNYLATAAEENTLVGYINITLDVSKFRLNWLYINIWLWLATVSLGLMAIWLVLRKINRPSKNITELAKVCTIVLDTPDLKQLPVIHQSYDFPELSTIRLAFVTLFNRLKIAQQKVDALAIFEQQLHNKDLSLDVQRHNFQSMINHELKTSLNAISGGLQLLNPQYLNEEQKDVIAIIHKGSQHLEATLEQIIQLNKIEKGQLGIVLSSFSPLQLLSDLVAEFEPIAKQKNVLLTSHIHHADHTLEGDTKKIKQVLDALISNAIKFTLQGQITIESQLTHFKESIRWQVKVIDTGIGIDDKYMNDLFTPFFQVDPSHTREYEGAGLGLPLVQQLVNLMSGTLEVKSELGFGSEFTVLLPLQNSSHNQRQRSLSSLNVVYYHHEPTSFIVDELQRLGASVSCQCYETSLTQQLSFDSIDIVMIAEEITPEQAIQIAQNIRQNESSHRVLLVYWYAAHKKYNLDNFEYALKAAGIDFYHSSLRDSVLLKNLLNQWLAWI